MQKIWLYPKSGLAGAGTAYDQHIFVSGILGVGRTVGHHQALRLRQNDVVLKFGSDKRGNILCVSPSGRTVFFIVPIFLGIFSTEIHGQS